MGFRYPKRGFDSSREDMSEAKVLEKTVWDTVCGGIEAVWRYFVSETKQNIPNGY